MVARRRRMRKPARRGRVAKRNGRKKSNLKPTNQYASIVETREFNEFVSNKGYMNNFNLSNFYRATTLAKNFQFYRAKSVRWEYMPHYNVFNQSNTALQPFVGRPQLYVAMNREQNPTWSGAGPTSQLFAIQARGANPRAFTKNVEIKYRPNWCSAGLVTYVKDPISGSVTSIQQGGLKKQYGWLSCPDHDAWLQTKFNPSVNGLPPGYINAPIAAGNVTYNGHDMYIEQENAVQNNICKVTVTVEWEFKGAKENYSLTLAEGVPNGIDVSGNLVDSAGTVFPAGYEPPVGTDPGVK